MSKPAGCSRKSNPKVMLRCAMFTRALLPSHSTSAEKARTASTCQAHARAFLERIQAGLSRGRPGCKTAGIMDSAERQREIQPAVGPQVVQATWQFETAGAEIVIVDFPVIADCLDG